MANGLIAYAPSSMRSPDPNILDSLLGVQVGEESHYVGVDVDVDFGSDNMPARENTSNLFGLAEMTKYGRNGLPLSVDDARVWCERCL